jgi:hypothetical protein
VGKAGVVDAAGGAALVAVVALSHHEFGEEAEVGELFAFGCGGDLFESVADGGQPQHAGAGVDRSDRGLLGDTAACAHELAFPRRSS